MKYQIVNSMNFFLDLDHYYILAVLALALVYGGYFYIRHGYKSRSQIIVFIASYMLLSYTFLTRHLTYHIISFFLLLLVSFTLYFKRESKGFQLYLFYQVGLIFVSYTCLLLFFNVGNPSSLPVYSFIDMKSFTISSMQNMYWHKVLLQVIFTIIIAFTFTFKKIDRTSYWFEKASIYFMGVTKAPIILFIALYANNHDFISSLLTDLRPIIFTIFILSLLGLSYFERMSRQLYCVNNVNVAIFWIVASIISPTNTSHLYHLVLGQIFVMFVFVVFYFNRVNYLRMGSEVEPDVKEYDVTFYPDLSIKDNVVLLWTLLLPGGFGYYMISYGALRVAEVSLPLVILLVAAYTWTILRNTINIINVTYSLDKDGRNKGWRNKSVYPLIAINVIILLSELIWKRVLLN